MSIEIEIKCSKCNEPINFAELDRIRRAYITLSRKSRANSYIIKCTKCGLRKSVRVSPENPFDYICKNCKARHEKDKSNSLSKGYHQKL